MQDKHKDGIIKADRVLTQDSINAINEALNAGYLVELMKLRDGTIKAKTVKKKEIVLPTV